MSTRRQTIGGLLAFAATMSAPLVEARWKPEYAQLSQEDKDWYSRQKTTPEWRDRVGKQWYVYCCDHADTVEAQFQKKGQVWQYRLPGTNDWLDLPQDIVQPDVMTPHSKPVLFIDALSYKLGPVCFFPGGAGT